MFDLGTITPLNSRLLCVTPHARCTAEKVQRFDPPLPVAWYARMLSADVDDRLQAEVLLFVESHQFIVGLEGDSVMTAVHD